MAIPLKVKWVEQSSHPELHLRIRQIGGDSGQMHWKHTQTEAVEGIESGLFAYHVEHNGRALRLDVAKDTDGRKYLTVHPGPPNALLELPGLPESTLLEATTN